MEKGKGILSKKGKRKNSIKDNNQKNGKNGNVMRSNNKRKKSVPAPSFIDEEEEEYNENQSSSTEDEEDDSVKVVPANDTNKNPEYDRIWYKKDKENVGSKIPDFAPNMNEFDSELVNNCCSPLEYYQLFQNEDFINSVVEESRRYAIKIGQESKIPHITAKNIYTSQAIMLLSGYNKLPNRKMYWEESPDTYSNIVANNMRRDVFESVIQLTHFVDNDNLDKEDRFFKVRPLFDNLNRCTKLYMPVEKSLSVDEVMVPYYGPHGDKQYIRGKPVRYGFKLWALCSSTGHTVHVEPYCGKSTRLKDAGLGQGPNVVMGLVEHAQVQEGSSLYFDNLFSSIPLLIKLSEKGLGGTGTMNQNRLFAVPLPDKKEMNKKYERGTYSTVYHEDLAVSGWKDNKPVYVCSNIHNAEPSVFAKRWCGKQKKKVDLPMPLMIREYNQGMGGVDLFDEIVALYRPRIRKRKWWWCLFAWSLSAR